MPLVEFLIRNQESGNVRPPFKTKSGEVNVMGETLLRLGMRRKREYNPIQTDTQDLYYLSGNHIGIRTICNVKAPGFHEAAILTQLTDEEKQIHEETVQTYLNGTFTSRQRHDLANTAFLVERRGWHKAYFKHVSKHVGIQNVQRAELYTCESKGPFNRLTTFIYDLADKERHFPEDPYYIFPVMAVENQKLNYTSKPQVRRGEYSIANSVKYTLTFTNGKSCEVIVVPLYLYELLQPRFRFAAQLLIKKGLLPVDLEGNPIAIL